MGRERALWGKLEGYTGQEGRGNLYRQMGLWLDPWPKCCTVSHTS